MAGLLGVQFAPSKPRLKALTEEKINDAFVPFHDLKLWDRSDAVWRDADGAAAMQVSGKKTR